MAQIPRYLLDRPKVLRDPDVCLMWGAFVSAARNAMGLSQNELAAIMGVTRATIVRLEQGIAPLRTVLCVTAYEIFKEAGIESEAAKDLSTGLGGVPVALDLSFEFQRLKIIRAKTIKPDAPEIKAKEIMGEDFVPPLEQMPLRRK